MAGSQQVTKILARRNRNQAKSTLRRLAAWFPLALSILITLLVLSPLVWAIATSLKSEVEAVAYPPVFWPSQITFENFARVLNGQNFLTELLNSVYYSLGSVILSILVSAPAAYAAARFNMRGKTALLLLILGSSMIPTVALLVPIFGLLDQFGMVNSALAIIVIEAARTAPQNIWFIRTFIEAVPKEIEEAAFIDGATRWQTFFTVVLPLIKPGLAATSILSLITVWNDYLTVAVFAPESSSRTLQVAIVNQVLDSNGISWSYMMAFVLVASAPVVAIFLASQRWFVSGLMAGGVKG
jgi:multiple sugar transport system permease protein